MGRKVLPYIISLALVGYIIYSMVDVVEIKDDGMTPLINKGQTVWGIKSEKYENNNIVIINSEISPKYKIARRIYAVEGDEVEIENNVIRVNGSTVKILSEDFPRKDVKFTLDKNELLLMGDSTNTSWMKVGRTAINSRLEVIR